MRNNAVQNRHIFSDQTDDREALVNRNEADLELGNFTSSANGRLPSQWTDKLEEIQAEINKIKKRTKELSLLHDRHLNRPTLDDGTEEEETINVKTQEITQMFQRCQRLIQTFNSTTRLSSGQEQKMIKNMVSSVARSLQDLSTSFRTAQSSYLKKLQGREERSNRYFSNGIDLLGTETNQFSNFNDMQFSDAQLQLVEDNVLFVQQREKEILRIVQSIQELNDIFKELSTMIVDQGTILDRIDYNVEQTSTHVEKGLDQLQKAAKYQKKSRKMLIIAVLFVAVIILLILLIGFKLK